MENSEKSDGEDSYAEVIERMDEFEDDRKEEEESEQKKDGNDKRDKSDCRNGGGDVKRVTGESENFSRIRGAPNEPVRSNPPERERNRRLETHRDRHSIQRVLHYELQTQHYRERETGTNIPQSTPKTQNG